VRPVHFEECDVKVLEEAIALLTVSKPFTGPDGATVFVYGPEGDLALQADDDDLRRTARLLNANGIVK
jgi:hypothetical protein